MIRKWFFNMRNALIISVGIIFALTYAFVNNNIILPTVMTSVALAVSSLYSVLTISPKGGKSNSRSETKNRLDNTNSVVREINDSIKSIKTKSRQNDNYLFISKFFEDIEEFENVIPSLVEDYKDGLEYINKNSGISKDIDRLKEKIASAKGKTSDTYEKALQEKLITLHEMDNIKSYLEESESRLQYILGTLQKTEAIMASSELNSSLNDEDATNLNYHMESFSDNFKSVIKSIKL